MQKFRNGIFASSPAVHRFLIIFLLIGGLHGIMGTSERAEDTARLQLTISELREENAALRNRTTKTEISLRRCSALRGGDSRRYLKTMEALCNETETKYRAKEAEAQLASCESLDFTDHFGNTGLHRAVIRRDEHSIAKIVGLGADMNVQNGHFQTPIMLAANIEDLAVSLRIIKYLGESGADLFAVDATGQSFLHKLVSRRDPLPIQAFRDLSEYLAVRNATKLFNIQDNVLGLTPLMLAVKAEEIDWETLSFLKSNLVDFAQLDKEGNSALSHYYMGKYANLEEAVEAGAEDAIKVMVILGANLNTKNENSETILHKAATVPDKAFALKIIKFLIQNGAEPSAIDKHSNTFLHRLVDDEVKLSPSQFHDIAGFLASRNSASSFNARENAVRELKLPRASWTFSQSTPFQLAVKNIEVLNETLSLLKKGQVYFNIGNDDDESVLFYAVAGERSIRLLSDLVAHGANPKHLNKWEDGLLHWSALLGNVEQLKFFLDLGLDIDAKDKRNGRTPLHRAVFNGRGDVLGKVRLLIDRGANVRTKHRWGESPLDSALKSGNLPDKDAIVRLLRDQQQ